MINKLIRTIFLIFALFTSILQSANSDESEKCSATEPCEMEVISATHNTVTIEGMVTATQVLQFVLRCDEFVMMRNSQVGDIVFVTLDFDGNVIVAKLTQ